MSSENDDRALIEALNQELDFHLLPNHIREKAYAMETERDSLRAALVALTADVAAEGECGECIYCYGEYDCTRYSGHKDDCPWVAARKLVEQ